MNIALRPNGATTIVDLDGDITLYNAPEVRKALMDLLKLKHVHVIVNLTKVRYIDSSGVACLVEALKVSREMKLGLALFGLSPVAKEVLELTRLIKVFDVYSSEEEALSASLAKSSSAVA